MRNNLNIETTTAVLLQTTRTAYALYSFLSLSILILLAYKSKGIALISHRVYIQHLWQTQAHIKQHTFHLSATQR